ncbi:MAG: pilus assembly protein [Bifidobacteriaceae bacterium]|jgi:Flp pilus assembly protein TadG|nr:pilus assembly protein [Bifidobacteriaceae bacterium]
MDQPPDRGSVTVELAMALPAVLGLIALLVALSSAAVGQLQLADAARAGARAAALGQPDAEVTAAAEAAAGRPVTVSLERSGGLVWVRCQTAVWIPLAGTRQVSSQAAAICEPERACGYGP